MLNIRGHRIGSGEIESVILSVKGIKEVSVIDTKDAISGTSIIVFLSLSKDSNNKLKIKNLIQKQIIQFFGKFAVQKKNLFC